MTDPKPTRWYRLTPDRLIIGLLVVEGLLWLSERYRWFGFNQHKGWTVLIAVAVVGVAMLVMLGWFATSLLFRWRFQFGIRTLLVVTLAVALPCSWLTVELKEARRQNQAAAAIRTAGAWLVYDWTPSDSPLGGLAVNPFASGPASPSLADRLQERARTWLAELFGPDFVSNVISVTGQGRSEYSHAAHVTADEDLRHLPSFPELEHLNLSCTDVTSAGLREVRVLRHLQSLNLTATRVDDAGMEHLRGLTGLEELDLDETQVSDAGLEHLHGLSCLQTLGLAKTRTSDAGLWRLRGLSQLRTLRLSGTRFTDGGTECLRGLTALERLDLSETRVTDAGLKCLRCLASLKMLCLSRVRISNAGLKDLEGLQQLQEFVALEADADEIGVARLRGKLPNISVKFSTRLLREDRKAIREAVRTPQVRALFGDCALRELSIVALNPAEGGGAEVRIRVLPFHSGLVFSLKKRDGKWAILSHGMWIGEGAIEEPPVEDDAQSTDDR